MNKLKLTAACLALALFASALPVSADGFITVSDWAYTQVSAFREAGFMPEAMEDVTDYTVNATREQFAELVYSMMTRFDNIDEYTGEAVFADTDNAKISALVQLGVINGVSETEFMPESLITREAAAAALYRAAVWCDDSGRFASLESTAAAGFDDYDEISDWAKEAVNEFCSCGIMIGSDNKFNPKANITIEEAILTISRACDWLPTFSDTTPDGGFSSALNAEEYENGFTLATYTNGYYKIRKGDDILITYGDSVDTSETVFTFGVDTYRSVKCAEADGKVYVFAMTYRDMTYVYDAESREVLYSIPCTGITVTGDDYFIAYNTYKGSDMRYRLYGVYAYDGEEIVPIEYSTAAISGMGFKTSVISVSGSSSTTATSSLSTGFNAGRMDGSVNEYLNADGDLVYDGTYITRYEADGLQYINVGREPLIYKGETVLIPLMNFAGYSLNWNFTFDSLTAEDRTITLTKSGKTVAITAGASTADVDGSEYALSYPAMLIKESGNEDIYICYTDFAELFGYESAVWSPDTKTVNFYAAGYAPIATTGNSSSLTATASAVTSTPSSSLLVRAVPGEEIKVYIDNRKIAFDSAKPFIDDNGKIQVPVKDVAEQSDYEVEWNEQTQTLIIFDDEHTIKFVVGSRVMTVDGKASVMDTAACMVGGSVCIPYEYVGEAFGYTVTYTEFDLNVETVTMPDPMWISFDNIYAYDDAPEEYKSVFAGCEEERGKSMLFSTSTYMVNEFFLEMFAGNTFDLSTGVYTANTDSFNDEVHFCYSYVLENASEEILIEYVPQQTSATEGGCAIHICEVTEDGDVPDVAYTNVGTDNTNQCMIVKVSGLDSSKKYAVHIMPSYVELTKPIIRVANLED